MQKRFPRMSHKPRPSSTAACPARMHRRPSCTRMHAPLEPTAALRKAALPCHPSSSFLSSLSFHSLSFHPHPTPALAAFLARLTRRMEEADNVIVHGSNQRRSRQVQMRRAVRIRGGGLGLVMVQRGVIWGRAII